MYLIKYEEIAFEIHVFQFNTTDLIQPICYKIYCLFSLLFMNAFLLNKTLHVHFDGNSLDPMVGTICDFV